MKHFNQYSNTDLNDILLQKFSDYYESGRELKHINTETYEMLYCLLFRKFSKSYSSFLSEYGYELIDDLTGDVLLRIKRKYEAGTPLILGSLLHYLDSTIRFAINLFYRKKYYTSNGVSIRVVLEDITEYAEDLTEDTMHRKAVTYPESIIMFKSELIDLVTLTRFHLGRNPTTNKLKKLLTWPVIVAAIRNRGDYADGFDYRTAVYLRYVIFQIRKSVARKFDDYKFMLT